jgi:hypothetical protein
MTGRDLAYVAIASAAAGAIAGVGLYYAVDRFAFAWGGTVRQARWAGWKERRNAA